MTLRPCFIAHFDQNVMFPIIISYIVLVQNKQKWTNQPLFNDIVTSKTIHYTNPWLQGEAWYILLVTLYTLMGLYGNFDKHFIFYCA